MMFGGQHAQSNHAGLVPGASERNGLPSSGAAAHGWRRVLLVSSGYHLARAEAVFRKAGLDVMPAGAEFLGLDGLDGKGSWMVVPRSRGFDLIGYWAHEQVGWIFYRWKGWV